MWYEVAADLIAVVHLGFLAFVVLGAILGRHNRWWRLVHIAAMAYGVLIEVFYWYCPLTYLEQYLRRLAGRGIYEEAFIAHYLNKIIYVNVPQWSLILAALVVLGANLGLYIHLWQRRQPLPQ
ncbi:MAG: DUF2784 domain-containing protein [Acidobacteria bacterium]|nr:DUF2784 domain-containing protein [Acidobacteriota bacterium]